MPANIVFPDAADTIGHTFGLVEDFHRLDTGLWAQSGTAVSATEFRGVATITGAANAHIKASREVWAIEDALPIDFAAYVKFTEQGAAGGGQLFIGLSDLTDSDGQLPAGALATTFHGAGFYTLAAQTFLSVASSIGTTQTKDQLTAENSNNLAGKAVLASSANYRLFKIRTRELAKDDWHVQFFVDGVHVAQHRMIGAASPTATSPLFCLITSGETVKIDFVRCHQMRVDLSAKRT